MAQHHTRPPHPQAGFTLVEIMVGLVIGLLTSLVIMQVTSVFEAQKRSTTGTADAQTNGSIALFNITRELRAAGYPLTSSSTAPTINSPLECTTVNIHGAEDTTVPNRLSPAVIVNGTSDTLTIRYGDSAMGGITTQLTLPATVANNWGCQTDVAISAVAISANGQICEMTNVTSALAATPNLVTLQDAIVSGNELACLGNWNEITYRVNNNNLERNGVPSVAGIVNLQVQYGISEKPDSNTIIQWLDASGGTWAAPDPITRNRIKAIRLAVVARNAKLEPTNVTEPCSSLNSASPTGLCAWAGSSTSPAPAIDLSADADWQRYRYRVFDTIIPLQNVILARGVF